MRVNIPSHSIYVTFPKDTPPEHIDKFLREKFGAKKEPEPIQQPEPVKMVEPSPKIDVKTLSTEELKKIIRGK